MGCGCGFVRCSGHLGVGQGDQHFDGLGIAAVDVVVVGLVEVRQQALVATGFANALAGGGFLLQRVQAIDRPGARRLVVVHQAQGLCSHLGHGAGFGGQAGEHARTALGRFVEQQGLAVVLLGQGFGHQFGFFDLEGHFNTALEGRLQGGHGLQLQRLGGRQDQDVAVVLDERNDLLVGHLVEQVGLGGV